MSDARTEADKKPLPAPVREDGIVDTTDDKRRPEDDLEDAGLADIGGGNPGERKII